jgi:hypothetical protein
MKRYCIICRTMFGCVKDGVKYSCNSCNSSGGCLFLDDPVVRGIKNGICEGCWEAHGSLKFKEVRQAA